MLEVVDLRSDTVTRPGAAMREAMARAEVGDDVYGDDPTVNRLEALAAEMLGTEAALFAPSGTQTNLIALLSHCQRGDEYIVGQAAHTYRYEAGGAAVLGSIQPQPLAFESDGTLDLDRVAETIKPDDVHFARSRLLCLENTHGGLALPMDYLPRAAEFARQRGLALHLDGARVFNAAVKHGVPVAHIAQHFDSISVCLSKGLGAPVGSVLCASRALIGRGRRWRKMLGGGMRQAGILAAAGIHALQHQVADLAEDHRRAAALARQLDSLDGVQVEYAAAQTNMVYVRFAGDSHRQFVDHAGSAGILISPGDTLRLVLHRDVDDAGVERTAECFRRYAAVM